MTWTTRPRSKKAPLSEVSAGAGPNVLLIHGVGLQAEAWNSQIDALSPHYDMQAVDMPGHGHSPCPHTSMRLKDYTDAIAAVMTHPALVVGHSMGAMIALDMAIRYPSRVCGVAALNAVYQRSAAAAVAVQARADCLDGVVTPDPSPTLERWFGAGQSPERQACEGWLKATDPAAYRMAYRVFAYEDGPAAHDLTALACPALFMTGAEEPNSTPGMSRAMAALTPKGDAIVVPGAAHMMPMTHSSAVNLALTDFAREVLQ